MDFRECSVADMGDAFVTLFKLQMGVACGLMMLWIFRNVHWLSSPNLNCNEFEFRSRCICDSLAETVKVEP